eukprot:g78813.t1
MPKRKDDAGEESKSKKKAKVEATQSELVHPLAPGDSIVCPSNSSYTIGRTESGFYTCDCPEFKFKKQPATSKICKHMRELGISKAHQAAARKVNRTEGFSLTKKPLDAASKATLKELDLPALKAQLKANGMVQLKANGMIVGGKKNELVQRIIWCREQGCLPRCPKCGGGILKVSGKNFKCPGYMDDTTFKSCNYTTDGSDCTFVPWKQAVLTRWSDRDGRLPFFCHVAKSLEPAQVKPALADLPTYPTVTDALPRSLYAPSIATDNIYLGKDNLNTNEPAPDHFLIM